MANDLKENAVANLNRLYAIIENKDCVDQTDLNVTSDYLRQYLGEHSHIYYSFSRIDINKDTRQKEIEEAAKLIKTAVDFIIVNGIYKDLQLQMLEAQIKDISSKGKIAFLSTVGGSILTLITTYAKDIGKVVLKLLHLQQP
jgi:hypothetical protein